MLRQLIVVFGTLTNGSVLSFMALQMLPVEMGLIAGILIFGAVLCILGIYVAQNDKKRQHLRRQLESRPTTERRVMLRPNHQPRATA